MFNFKNTCIDEDTLVLLLCLKKSNSQICRLNALSEEDEDVLQALIRNIESSAETEGVEFEYVNEGVKISFGVDNWYLVQGVFGGEMRVFLYRVLTAEFFFYLGCADLSKCTDTMEYKNLQTIMC